MRRKCAARDSCASIAAAATTAGIVERAAVATAARGTDSENRAGDVVVPPSIAKAAAYATTIVTFADVSSGSGSGGRRPPRIDGDGVTAHRARGGVEAERAAHVVVSVVAAPQQRRQRLTRLR